MNIELPRFDELQVLVIGDVMLDRYWYGNTARISPEAPVPVTHIQNIEERPGGASNVALNVTALGAQATLLGIVGKDEAARSLHRILSAANVNDKLVTTNKYPTITKQRVISHNQQMIRLDFEQTFCHTSMQPLLKQFERCLAKNDLVIISDYGKGIAKQVPQLIKLARAHNLPVIVDPKGQDFSIYQGATLITPNSSEFQMVTGPFQSDEELQQKGLTLLSSHNIDALLVTRGSDGMSLIRPQHDALHTPAHASEVYDVTGAGDTVIATLGTALAARLDLDVATYLANIAAGIVVRKLGASVVTPAELRRALQRQHDSWLGIINQERLCQYVADAQSHGETIVMTNGCFDILHAGHTSYLEQAKTLGKRLIVAVNDDSSIKRLKGDGRPINNLAQRMAVLSALRSVDWVVPFSEDTPEKLIKMVKPDVLVKGGDYKVSEIAGADFVIKNGGEVKILKFIDDHSTSIIINRIRGKQK